MSYPSTGQRPAVVTTSALLAIGTVILAGEAPVRSNGRTDTMKWSPETIEAELTSLEAGLKEFGLKTPFGRARQLVRIEKDWDDKGVQARWESRIRYWPNVLGKSDEDSLLPDPAKLPDLRSLMVDAASRKLLFETQNWGLYDSDDSYRFERAENLLQRKVQILGLDPAQMAKDADYDWLVQHPTDKLFQVAHQNCWSFMYLALAHFHLLDDSWAREWMHQVVMHITDCPRLPDGWNDFGKGPNPGKPANVAWSHHGYVGVRLKFLALTYLAMKDSPILSDRFHRIVSKAIREHARHLHGLNRRAFASNYLTVTGQALYLAGALFPQFEESQAWLTRMWPNYVQGTKRELLKDGCHYHRSLSYHLTFVKRPLGVLALASKLKQSEEIPEDFISLTREAVDAFAKVSTPIRSTPGINDDWTVKVPNHNVLGLAAETFGREDWRYLAIDGKAGKEPQERSVLLPHAQLIAMRSGWSKNANYLLFNVSPDGGHHHPDTLSVQIWSGGHRLLIDPGTGHYYTGERGLYTRSWWHNCPTLGKRQLPDKVAPKVLHWETTDELDYAVGQIEVPVPRAKAKLRIRRHVFFVERSYWVLYDEFLDLPPGVEIWENFHFPSRDVKLSEDGRKIVTTLADSPNLLMCVGQDGWAAETEDTKKWLVYGEPGLPTKVVHFRASQPSAAKGFSAAFIPLGEDDSADACAFEAIETSDDGAVALRIAVHGKQRRLAVRGIDVGSQ